MSQSKATILLTTLVLGCASGGPPPTPGPTPVAPVAATVSSKSPANAPMWADAGQVLAACDDTVRRSEERVAALKAGGAPTTEAGLEPYNAVLFELERVASTAELIAATHPDHGVRGAAEVCDQAMKRFRTEVTLDRALYEVLSAIDTSKMTPGAQRFVAKTLREFRRAGVDKDPATRDRLRALDGQMVKLRQDFSRRIRESRGWIEVPAAALKGMPQDFITSHPADEEGVVELTTDYPDFFPIETYATDEKVRERLYRAFLNRAYPANDDTLMKLVSARHEYANLLGFPSWTAFMADDKMIASAEAIEAFIQDIAEAVRPRVKKELASLLAYKRKENRGAKAVQVWDRFFYVQKVRKAQYGFDAEAVRNYFEYGRVSEGVMGLFGELFGLRFEPDPSAPVWHPSVTAWRVFEGDRLVGRFFLDMHPRADKYEHAAMFPLGIDRSEGMVPMAALVCNFPDPKASSGPALLDHGQVRTFFHEFGHIVHHLLATSSPWANQAGISVELDFVEAPAQLFEEWAWDARVLGRFARHVDTGEAIPAEMVDKMRASEEFGKGIDLMRQVYFAALSAQLHARDPKTLDLPRFQREMMKAYSPYPYPEGTYGYASFTHLEVYSSMYYTYQWSLTLAKDLMTRFRQDGLLDKDTARGYADAVLRPGGSKSARQLVEDFLGREPNLEAYRSWLGAN